MMEGIHPVRLKLLEKVKKHLRPTLISRKGGVSLDMLNKDYADLMGEGRAFLSVS